MLLKTGYLVKIFLRYRIITILLLLLGCKGLIKSQVVTVIDVEIIEAIEYATLTGGNPNLFAVTNSKGQTDLSQFVDEEKIEIRCLGYRTVYKSYAEIDSMNFKVGLKRSNHNLNELIVSATQWEQSSGSTPFKISTISPKLAALHNPQTSADLLGISGKVFIQKSQQGGGSPIIRGFATNRLLYIVDGVRMNTAIFRGGNIQNIINLDPFCLKSTEVLFGPGSAMYGSDAIGGVMNFQTLTPQLSLNNKPQANGKVLMRFSSASKEKTGHFDLNLGFKKWAFVSSISYWDFDHLKQGSNGPEEYIKNYYVVRRDGYDIAIKQDEPLLQVPSAYMQINLMQKVRFVPNHKWNIEYGFHYSETSSYGRYDRHNRTKNSTARYAEWNYGPQKWMMNNFVLKNSSSGIFYDQMKIHVTQQSFEESRISRELNNDERSTQTENVDAYSVNLNFHKIFSPKNDFYYGTEYVLNDVSSKGLLTNISNQKNEIGASRYPNARWSSLGLYVKHSLKLSEKFITELSGRYNFFQLNADFSNNLVFYPLPFSNVKMADHAFTGNIGCTYHPSLNTIFRMNISTGFRSPNVDDLGKIFDSEPGSITVPNKDLKPEYAYNIDIGIAKVFQDIVKVDLTAFYTFLNNAMVRRDFQLNGMDSIFYDRELSQVQAIQNSAFAKVYGIQMGVDVKLFSKLKFRTDLNYQAGQEILENGSMSSSRHAAPFFGTSSLNYNRAKFVTQFYLNFQSMRKYKNLAVEEQNKDEVYAKDQNGNNYSPAWYTLNIKASYKLNPAFSINTGIENLTDQRYRPYSSGISSPGRNFSFSVMYKY